MAQKQVGAAGAVHLPSFAIGLSRVGYTEYISAEAARAEQGTQMESGVETANSLHLRI